MSVWQLRNNNASLNNDVFFSKCKSTGLKKETDPDISEKNNIEDTEENTDTEVNIYQL